MKPCRGVRRFDAVGDEYAAYLRRDDDISRSADVREGMAEALFTQAEAVVRSGIEVLHPMVERGAQSRRCICIGDFAIQISKACSESQAANPRNRRNMFHINH